MNPGANVEVVYEGIVTDGEMFIPDSDTSVRWPLRYSSKVRRIGPGVETCEHSKLLRALTVVCCVLVVLVLLVGALAAAAYTQSHTNGKAGVARTTIECSNWTTLHPGQPLIKACR